MKTITRKSGIWHYISYDAKNKKGYVIIEKPNTLTFGEYSPLFKAKYVVSFKKRPEVYCINKMGKIYTPMTRHMSIEKWLLRSAYIISSKKGNPRYIQKGKVASVIKLMKKVARRSNMGIRYKFSCRKTSISELMSVIKYRKLLGKSVKDRASLNLRISYIKAFELSRFPEKDVRKILNLPTNDINYACIEYIMNRFHSKPENKEAANTYHSYKDVAFECRFQRRFPEDSDIYLNHFRYKFQNMAEHTKGFWGKVPKRFKHSELNELYKKRNIKIEDIVNLRFNNEMKDILANG